MLSLTKSRHAGKSFFFKLFLLITLLVLSSGDIFTQVNWTKYPGNPVMSGSGNGTWDKHVFMPSVLFNADSNRYEMWYCGSYGPEVSWLPYRIGFAWSADGINWTKYGNPVLNPDPGTWDAGSVEVSWVIRENGQYKMWYAGLNNNIRQIGYATSPDGITWTKNANPVLSAGSAAWEAGGVFWCSVLSNSGQYTMYYTGVDITQAQIGRATSLDGINWQRDTINNPVLSGTLGQWDEDVFGPRCLFTGNLIHMWYTGVYNNERQIGYATSPDGIIWDKNDNPVLTKGSSVSWDGSYVEAGTVMLLGDSVFQMWYDGSREYTPTNLWRIGVATAPLVSVSVEQEITLPTEFTLEQCYPNPFNPSTTIHFSIPKEVQVNLSVYNILGENIRELKNEMMKQGYYDVEFNASDLASGIYLYRIKAGDFVETKKMIFLK